MKRLPLTFYRRDAVSVARDLIGCIFVHDDIEGRTSIRIVEDEAYRGVLDPGSHGYRGLTQRTEVMYGSPGRLYVYFTYGMHWCANVVCAPKGQCEAVLLRAGEPIEGVDLMRARRPAITKDTGLAAGPARLTQAMGIGKQHNGATLLRGGRFFIAVDENSEAYRAGEIAQTVRVGLGAGKGEEIPWRFVVPGNRFASRRS
jgi:DNA-3-methyladenine glycosylase